MPEQRTLQQNKSLHKLFELWAEALNDAGLDMRVVLKPEVEIPWTKESVKTYLWKPVQRYMLGKEHTADLETKEIDQVFEAVNRILGEKHGIQVPFPADEPPPPDV